MKRRGRAVEALQSSFLFFELPRERLVVALSRRAVLVVLLVELATTLVGDGVGRVSRRATGRVDGLREERLLRGSIRRQQGIRSGRLSLLTAAAAAADAEDESEENEASTDANENHQSEARNLALQVAV